MGKTGAAKTGAAKTGAAKTGAAMTGIGAAKTNKNEKPEFFVQFSKFYSIKNDFDLLELLNSLSKQSLKKIYP